MCLVAAAAQGPTIGIIDFYGLHRVPEAKIRQALGVREGDSLPRSKGGAEEKIDDLPGVVESHLEAVCCDAGRMILYVGIEEKGATHFELRDAPDTDIQLPEEVSTAYHRFLEVSEIASRNGQTKEDLTNGHALSSNPDARAIQQEFIPIVKRYLGELRNVIHNSSDEEQRAIAVYVIAYAQNKRDIADDLQYALKDSDQGVRSNATRSLKGLAVYARLQPDAEVKIEPTWFIEMLNSLSWSDRRQSLEILQILTDKREESTMNQLRDRALPALVEMARWKALSHALPAFVLVGRVAGMSDDQIQAAWAKGDREPVIAAALAKKKG